MIFIYFWSFRSGHKHHPFDHSICKMLSKPIKLADPGHARHPSALFISIPTVARVAMLHGKNEISKMIKNDQFDPFFLALDIVFSPPDDPSLVFSWRQKVTIIFETTQCITFPSIPSLWPIYMQEKGHFSSSLRFPFVLFDPFCPPHFTLHPTAPG